MQVYWQKVPSIFVCLRKSLFSLHFCRMVLQGTGVLRDGFFPLNPLKIHSLCLHGFCREAAVISSLVLHRGGVLFSGSFQDLLFLPDSLQSGRAVFRGT